MEFYGPSEQERLGNLIQSLKQQYPSLTAAERADRAIDMMARGISTNGNGKGH